MCVTSLCNQLQKNEREGKGEEKGREATWGKEVEGSGGQNPEGAGQAESENHTICRGHNQFIE